MDRGMKRNHLGIRGWIYGGRYGIERYAYALHRLTGLGLLLYLPMHIHVTGYKIRGKDAWDGMMGAVGGPVFHAGEFLVFLAFAYHALNGVRLVLTELGFGLGRPAQPVYPYRTSVMRQRPIFIVVMAIAGVVAVLGGLDMFVFTSGH